MEELAFKGEGQPNKQSDRSFRIKQDCLFFLFDDVIVITKRSGSRNSNLETNSSSSSSSSSNNKKANPTKRVQFDSMLSVAELTIKEVSWFAAIPG